MRAVIQRVKHAAVSAGGETVGKTDVGLLVLLGVAKGDTADNAKRLAGKIARMRIFDDENGMLSKSVTDVGGGVLVVSNFTLYGSAKKGNRPDFTKASPAEEARELYLLVLDEIANCGVKSCESGRFGAEMTIAAELDGPVTIIIDTDTL